MTAGGVEPGPGVCSGVSLEGMGLQCMPTATRREVQDRLVTGRGARGGVRWWWRCAWARVGGSTATLDQSERSATFVLVQTVP